MITSRLLLRAGALVSAAVFAVVAVAVGTATGAAAADRPPAPGLQPRADHAGVHSKVVKAAVTGQPGDFTQSFLCTGVGSAECFGAGAATPEVMHLVDTEYLLTYPGNAFVLYFQSNGDLVEYYGPGRQILWSSHTAGRGVVLRLQPDGNVVIYDARGKGVWQTHTAGTGANRFGLAPNGDLGAWKNASSNNTSGNEVWSNHVSKANPGSRVWSSTYDFDDSNPYEAVMQGDGNFVLYNFSRTTKALWSSRTAGHAGATLVTQPDGNAVIYFKGKAIWSTKTRSTTPVYFEVSDREVDLVNEKGSYLWHRP